MNALLVPFLDDSPQYARGCELGMLFEQMKRRRRIRGYYLTDNQEQITLMANRLGWQIVSMNLWDEAPDQWFYLDMKVKL